MPLKFQEKKQLWIQRKGSNSRRLVRTLAPGDAGVAKRTAQTAPKGAIVIEMPFGAKT